MDRDFPENFVWGAVSCPACSEGETVSDWARLSAPDGSVPDDGPRHWRRYRFDFRMMANMGLRAYRFGCDWGRLQRGPYQPFVRDDLYRYLEMLAELRSLGIEPWLVLFQNALPRWASGAGGWLNKETPHWFADYVKRLADVTDGEAMHWVTVFEPQMYAFCCHAWGWYPGGGWGRLDHVRRVVTNLCQAHCLATEALRRRLPGCRVGMTVPGSVFLPKRGWHPGDRAAAGIADWCLNRYGQGGFARGGRDFVMVGMGDEAGLGMGDGLSLSSVVGSAAVSHRGNGNGCRVKPDDRRRRLRKGVAGLGVPVYVTGGCGGVDGLRDLLEGCAGSGVSGFFYDSLLDQFDLRRGLSGGRGLLQVDFHDSARRRDVRDVGWTLGRIIKSGKVR